MKKIILNRREGFIEPNMVNNLIDNNSLIIMNVDKFLHSSIQLKEIFKYFKTSTNYKILNYLNKSKMSLNLLSLLDDR